MSAGDDTLSGLWYIAMPARELKKGALVRRILFREPVVFGRTAAGEAFALRDVCPHRAAPLSAGRIVEGERPTVACPYHAWKFDIRTGSCTEIPALVEARGDVSKIGVKHYPVHEANGVVWIYRPQGPGDEPPPPPEAGLAAQWKPKVFVREKVEGPYDETVIGLIDPAHTPYVHKQWWWREGKPLNDKVKTYEPTALGFRLPPHTPSSNTRVYKFFGAAPTTEIEFRLPAVRVETIRNGKRSLVGLTCVTPTDENACEILHFIFWDILALDFIRPFAQHMGESFLAQDGAILRAQNMNLSRENHRPLYVGDPDEPAKWYLKLKRAWAERAPGAPFDNPVSGGELRWRT